MLKIEKNGNILFLVKANQVKLGILNTSLKIVDENNNILMHFSNSEITSFDLIDNSIYIYSTDTIPFVLRFSSNEEAEIANNRINDIINGQNVV